MTPIRRWTGRYELLHWLLVFLAAIGLIFLVARVLGAIIPNFGQ